MYVLSPATDAVNAYDTVVAFVAQLAVPCNDPVIPCVTVSEPLTVVLFCDIKPFLATNSFAMFN
jgi:hypothetical protein